MIEISSEMTLRSGIGKYGKYRKLREPVKKYRKPFLIPNHFRFENPKQQPLTVKPLMTVECFTGECNLPSCDKCYPPLSCFTGECNLPSCDKCYPPLSYTQQPLTVEPVAIGEFINDNLSMAVGSCELDEEDTLEDEEDDEDEEDTLSTASTIDYLYPEEINPREDEEDDEEEDSTPREDEEEDDEDEVSAHSRILALKYASSSALSRMVSMRVDSRKVSDYKTLDQWINSCKVSDAGCLEPLTWIHVYAYFNKEELSGGYGVIIRNKLGVPIVALAKFSKAGCSFYHQVFKGINAGVALAERRGRSHFHVRCNSLKLPNLFHHVYYCSKCKHVDHPGKMCTSCKGLIRSEKGCRVHSVEHLVVELRQKKIEGFESSWDLAAHYLAKFEKKKIQAENKEKRLATNEDECVTEPAGFPRRLKRILWADSFVMSGRRYQKEAKCY